MSRSVHAVLAVTAVLLLAGCAEQEMDAAEMGNASHVPTAAPSATPAHPADSSAAHGVHGADSVSTTTSH